MEKIFLLNFIISLLIFLTVLFRYFKHYKNKNLEKVSESLFFIGALYFVLSLFFILWYFEKLEFKQNDFLLIFTFLIIIKSLLFYRITRLYTKNKSLSYILYFYFLSLLTFFSPNINFYYFSLISSFLLLLALFIVLIKIFINHKTNIFFGIVYCSISLLGLILLNKYGIILYSLIINSIFLFFIFYFYNQLNNYQIYNKERKNKYSRSLFLVFLRHFVFVVIIINLVFIGTIALHEFGHFLISKYYGCEYSKIIYESNLFYTETLCKDSNRFLLLLGGILLPLIVSLPVFLIGGLFMRDMSLLVIGFDLIISYKDLNTIGLSDNLILLIILMGLFFLISGLIMLAKSRTGHHIDTLFNI